MAELFLEVIVRRVPGLVGSVKRYQRAIKWDLATLQCDIGPSDRDKSDGR
ncbi:hypothetical protein EMIT0196P_90176 [Pseudomonas chlororaphis]